MTAAKKAVRIGGGSAFWGDSSASLTSLIHGQKLDYLMLEYLAEITMALLARVRAKSEDAGFVPDFIAAMDRHLQDLKSQNIKVITNAGGVNPAGCGRALAKLAADKGIKIKIAVIEGDDLTKRADELREKGIGDWRTGAPLPPTAKLQSINAYLGATPIAAALAEGADVVITGRSVDSALALGPLMHEFGWKEDAFDLLAAGSLCGHLIECGPQMTGGNFTDWDTVPGWDNMGYPIAECYADGTFIVTKPTDTGGLVTPATVGEQMLYEIDDPGAYLLPDVAVDLRQVQLKQQGPNVVHVSGARGRAPTPHYKATVTFSAGYRCVAVLMIGGIDAAAKARRTAEAILDRSRRIFRENNFGDFDEVNIETLGAEATYGSHSRASQTREVMVKIGVKHSQKNALEIFAKEVAPSSIAMAPGITGFYAGRPSVAPVISGCSALIPKSDVPVTVSVDGRPIAFEMKKTWQQSSPAPALPPIPAADDEEATVKVRLIDLAYARSGDKGDDALVAVLARKPEFLPYIASALSVQSVTRYFDHVLAGAASRFDVPGVHALIFQLRNALGGGGITSVRIDPQGKCFGQMILDMDVPVPKSWLQKHGLQALEASDDASRGKDTSASKRTVAGAQA